MNSLCSLWFVVFFVLHFTYWITKNTTNHKEHNVNFNFLRKYSRFRPEFKSLLESRP